MNRCTTFRTRLGWMSALAIDDTLCFLTVGHDTAAAARRAVADQMQVDPEPGDWNDDLPALLRAYAAGEPVSLDGVRISLAHLTAFQRSVVRHCRAIPLGQTLSYGQLAAKAGSPHAARAVGNVMAGNRYPLIVPCHRVVGAGGHLGGFSAPKGIAFKQRLLELEQQALLAT